MNTKLNDQNSSSVYTRLPLELVQTIEQRAADADRTVSGEVRHLIRKALDSEQEGSAAAAAA